MEQFILDIYTPYGHYLSDKVDFVSLKSEKYNLGLLAGHADIISTIALGQIMIQKGENKDLYATSGGILRIDKGHVSLLLETIESVDEIDLDRAIKAKERAENRLLNKDIETISVTSSKLALDRAINRINTKKGIDQ